MSKRDQFLGQIAYLMLEPQIPEHLRSQVYTLFTTPVAPRKEGRSEKRTRGSSLHSE